ncbi:11131_t:CDS:2 [Funneliformis geosporum]|uniref:11131_t:CDS:1 n=1 Tax=Funneliformis geosporum TaxID=1117311 RepID=A0A9W4SME0_9GLOM|nr:11131_t:CDS:2 [Funneliformis geosporum]
METKTLQTLTQLLKNDQRLVVDGNLAKNKIIELALQLDAGILKLIKSSSELRKIFFVEVEDILVFDKIKFQNFISNKQFLPNSFTQYKNKIGLTADRQYLANNEIDRLLTPKVLTNFQKYEVGKEVVEMNDISLNDNLIIKGNNLLSLYLLKERYQGKIIYIDPPYNTGKVAKKLLTADGCLIVAIDKDEQAELTVLLKEVFRGYEIHVITVIHNPKGRTQATGFSYIHEEMSKNCFYPILVENEKVIGFGEVLESDKHPEKSVVEKNGKFVEEIKDFMRARRTGNGYKIEFSKDFEIYKTVWDSKKYDASSYGTKLLKDLIPGIKLAADEKDSRFSKVKSNNFDTNETSVEFNFFAGSGTTAHAVLELNKQDNGNRKFILCEQMDYIETVTKERIRKVCEIDNKGSFIYCELANYQLDPKNIDNTKSDFGELSLANQQKFLISLLDKNLLYVPYCDMEDKSYKFSEKAKKLNRQFYGER